MNQSSFREMSGLNHYILLFSLLWKAEEDGTEKRPATQAISCQ